ncbi:GTA-gp10 family protein [Sphingobium boeckii]|uniref:Gene transfer agent family protein n=1 Tax=Sphingobium boeckii TaxID=1082345 RepID=A0A7W9EDT2_9SPHN|nr:GTA-gp10 family protein [Sphingobium boeckii]MBB5684290.1 hypothetical protein [Sphingobium boeckii]
MTANALRGEVTLTLDGTEYVLRPSYEATLAVEEQTGKSLLDLAVLADDGALTLRQMAIVTTEYIRAWGRETDVKSIAGVQAERIGELIYDTGTILVQPRLAIVLARATTGGSTPGEATATGMKTTETPAAA